MSLPLPHSPQKTKILLFPYHLFQVPKKIFTQLSLSSLAIPTPFTTSVHGFVGNIEKIILMMRFLRRMEWML